MTDYLKTVFFIAAFALLALDCQMNTAPTDTLPAKLDWEQLPQRGLGGVH